MLCRDSCGYCTFAKAPARVTAPYLLPEEVLAIAEAGKAAGCHEALFTLGERPELRYPVAAEWLAGAGLRLDGGLPRRHVPPRPGGDRPAPPRQRRRARRRRAGHAAPGGGQPGDDARVAGRGPRRPPGVARQGAGPAAGHAGVRRRAGHPLHHRHPGRHRRRRGPTSWPPCTPSPPSHARHGHVQEVIVQNFLPKAGTAMFRAAPCPPEDLQWAIAAARLVLPPEIHVQAPPNLSDDLGPLLDAGIDDWGGVSPVTADHVNPERAWPALDILREATEAAGHTLAPRLTIYPTFAHDPARWLDPALRFPVLDASDAEGLARDASWCSGGEEPPPPLLDQTGAARAATGAVATGRRCRGRGAGRRGAGPGGRRGRDRHALQRPRPRGAHGGRGGRRPAPPHRRRRRHLRAQPQHQLHQRLHVQVPLLRLLQGPALAQPARRAVPAGARRDHAARGGGGRARARPRSACRAASTPTSTATTTCTCSGRCGRLDRHPHPRLHRAGGDRGGTALRGAAGRVPDPPEGGRPQDAAGHGGRDPRRRGARHHLPRQDQHRGVAGGAPHRAQRRPALQHHHHVRLGGAAGELGPPHGAHPRPAARDRRLHRVRAAALRAHGHPDLPAEARPGGDRPSARPCSCTRWRASPTRATSTTFR